MANLHSHRLGYHSNGHVTSQGGVIKKAGIKAGVSLNPATPLMFLDDVLEDIDLALIMSVNPGFGGQSFIKGSLDKIARLRKMLDDKGLSDVELQVDGGIKIDNIAEAAKAGADVFVAGSAIFGKKDYKGIMDEMRERARQTI